MERINTAVISFISLVRSFVHLSRAGSTKQASAHTTLNIYTK